MKTHEGRSWDGHRMEDECSCPQEPCGLVSEPDPECEQHGHRFARTMRQIHRAEDCPSRDLEPDTKLAIRALRQAGVTDLPSDEAWRRLEDAQRAAVRREP